MIYRALMRFADLMDGGRIYEAGEQYPRPGLDVKEERIAELAGSDNRAGYPMIARVVEPDEHGAKVYVIDMPIEVKPAAKGRRSSKKG